MSHQRLSNHFTNFANRECKGSSPLYEYLSSKIAEDTELLELSSFASDGQPAPNLLFGAVQFLLLQGKQHPLKNYYPSLVEHPMSTTESFIPFKDFCRAYRKDIITILQNKLVQTNEVRRCGYLYPSFSSIYQQVKKPLSLIEIGTSAGLQLLWDQFKYSYGTSDIYGNPESNVHIESEIKGETPFILKQSPPVAHRIGVDLHVNDLSDFDDCLWLEALIWPEHKERRNIFTAAAQLIHTQTMELVKGNGVDILPNLVQYISEDSVLCVFHTHVANQMPVEKKLKLIKDIREIGSKRDISHIYNNIWDGKLHLDSYINGVETLKIIGDTDAHGRWFEWKN